MVAEGIRPLREASIDVGLGGFFGLCSPVLRTSSPSSMVASHAACCAAYEDKGGLSIRVHSEKMHDVASPEDGVEGALLEHQSEAWVKQASALSAEVVDVMTDMGMGPCEACVPGREVIIEVFAPVLQIMPELQELCGESSVVPSLELGSLESLVVTSAPSPPSSGPCQSLATLSSEAGVLAPNSETLFGKELCDLLVRLETASPGYGMKIASILVGNASEDVIKKVEMSLRIKKKNGVITWKVSASLD
jgi:hypothetical protein